MNELLDQMKKRNNELVKSNVKYATLNRKLEMEIILLKQSELNLSLQLENLKCSNSQLLKYPAFESIQRIVKCAIEEHADLVDAFHRYNEIYTSHSLKGLSAIAEYEVDEPTPHSSYLPKLQKESPKKPKIELTKKQKKANITLTEYPVDSIPE
ncbi:hypothetical protein HDV04_003348 [Boothiomyces sp. JEL0838]|nr:hypothetical protein HDV04_003348 [Boothiomyces sp. JEL0838]